MNTIGLLLVLGVGFFALITLKQKSEKTRNILLVVASLIGFCMFSVEGFDIPFVCSGTCLAKDANGVQVKDASNVNIKLNDGEFNWGSWWVRWLEDDVAPGSAGSLNNVTGYDLVTGKLAPGETTLSITSNSTGQMFSISGDVDTVPTCDHPPCAPSGITCLKNGGPGVVGLKRGFSADNYPVPDPQAPSATSAHPNGLLNAGNPAPYDISDIFTCDPVDPVDPVNQSCTEGTTAVPTNKCPDYYKPKIDSTLCASNECTISDYTVTSGDSPCCEKACSDDDCSIWNSGDNQKCGEFFIFTQNCPS
jgi:hypothetical protein